MSRASTVLFWLAGGSLIYLATLGLQALGWYGR